MLEVDLVWLEYMAPFLEQSPKPITKIDHLKPIEVFRPVITSPITTDDVRPVITSPTTTDDVRPVITSPTTTDDGTFKHLDKFETNSVPAFVVSLGKKINRNKKMRSRKRLKFLDAKTNCDNSLAGTADEKFCWGRILQFFGSSDALCSSDALQMYRLLWMLGENLLRVVRKTKHIHQSQYTKQ